MSDREMNVTVTQPETPWPGYAPPSQVVICNWAMSLDEYAFLEEFTRELHRRYPDSEILVHVTRQLILARDNQEGP